MKNHTIARYLACSCLLILVLAMAGCFPPRASNSLLGDTRTQRLALGVSIAVPANWQVAVVQTSLSDAEILERIKQRERITLLDMQFNHQSDSSTNARAFLQVVNADSEFMPRSSAENMSVEDFALMGETFMRLDAELAQKNYQESRLLKWEISSTTVDGVFAVRQDGLGTRGQGLVSTLFLDVYLPNSAGLVVRLLADNNITNSAELLEALASSIRISPAP